MQASFDGTFRTPTPDHRQRLLVRRAARRVGIDGSQPAEYARERVLGWWRTHAALVEAIQIRTFDGSQLAAGKLPSRSKPAPLDACRADASGCLPPSTRAIPSGPRAATWRWDATLSGSLITLAGFNWPAGGGELQAVRVAFSADGPIQFVVRPRPQRRHRRPRVPHPITRVPSDGRRCDTTAGIFADAFAWRAREEGGGSRVMANINTRRIFPD